MAHNIFSKLSLLVGLLFLFSSVSCSDESKEDDKPEFYIQRLDEPWKEIKALTGKITSAAEGAKFIIDDNSANAVALGLGSNAVADIEIVNFKGDFLNYPEGCRVDGLIRSTIRHIYISDAPSVYYYELEISDIRDINEPEPKPEPSPQPEVYDAEFVAGRLDIDTGGKAITSKEDYVDCTVSLSHSMEAAWSLSDVKAGIRGRGNSTWEWYPKKPYRIKFDKKQPMLGLPSAKSWVLLAEYRDPTDLMNAFVFELGQLLEMPATNHNRYVEVWLNGEYIGLYHLTEQVQQNKNRVDIDETTGYLIQLDKDDGPELSPLATDNFWSKVYGMPVCVKNPDTPSAAVLKEVKDDLAQLENAIHSRNWQEVGKLLNVTTMIDFIAIQELIYNVELDAPRSMYMHRDPLTGTKWTMGPLWDFDAGFDFDWGTMTTGHNYFASYRELVLGTAPATHTGTSYRVPGFFSELFLMPEFVEAYKARWKEIAALVPVAMETAEKYALANKDAFGREAAAWPIGKNSSMQITQMKTWLTNRVKYLDGVVAAY